MRALFTTFFLFSTVLCIAQSGVISASKEKGCVPFNVNFSYSSNNVTSYLWEFGNGSTSIVASPTILFNTPGIFSVKLKVVQSDGQVKNISFLKNIEAIAKPVASFNSSTSVFCANTPILFNNTSVGANTYLWDFGDGITSNLVNPQHTYTEEGSYTVSLIAYNELNCPDVITKNNFVDITIVTPLEIVVDTKVKCINDPVFNFTTSSNFKSYLWDFGDGNTSAQNSPSNIYSAVGKYTINLEAVTNEGCVYTKSMKDFVTVADLADPTIKLSDSIICVGGEIDFSGTFDTNDSVSWEFSDGFITSEKQFSRVFDNGGNYSYTVKTTNPSGCSIITTSKTDIQIINVPKPVIDFGITKGCTPFKVNLTNNTSNILSTEWELNGEKLSGNSVAFEITKEGKYSLKAWLEYKSGCTKLIQYDSVYEINGADNEIIASSYIGCNPLKIDLQLKNSNVTNIEWAIGENLTSKELKPTAEFDTPGEYSISVSFDNEFGCKQNLILDVPIKVYSNEISYAPPAPIFTCQSTEVFFNGGIGKDFWHWDFGDGTNSTESNPSHYYENTGTYTVLLKTNNIYGCESKEIKYNEIVVNKLTADITSSIVDTTKGCPNFTVQFNSNSASGTSNFWDFGNGFTSSASNPRIDFSTTSPLNVRLTVTDSGGCSKTTLKTFNPPWLFCHSNDGDADVTDIPDSVLNRKYTIQLCNSPATVQLSNPRLQAKSWFWDFGDNVTSKDREVTHTYNEQGVFYVDLISYYKDGNIDTLDNFIEVIIEKPNVNFSYSQQFVCSNYEVSFSNILDNTEEWLWEFGDGGVSSEMNPIHNFSSPGVYQVSLSAINSYGCQSKVVKNVIIGNQYLDFDYENQLCKNDELSIRHNLQGFNKYLWDFGDGQSSSQKFPTHTYQNSGLYMVSVEAFDKKGCSETFILLNSVQYNAPKADFKVNVQTGCNSKLVKFTNKSTNADEYYWLFGDSAFSTKENPQNVYESGNYDVTLVASKNMCSDTLKINDLIKIDSISADFEFVKEQNCLPTKVNFINKSINANNWHWDFGDGSISEKKSPVHIYEALPSKMISLTASNSNGCKATSSKAVGAILSVEFEANESIVCKGQEINFINQSQNVIKSEWDFGDGTFSDLKSPNHSYERSGNYDVKLTATGTDGCTMELVKQKFIKVNEVRSDFNIKDNNSGCAPLPVDFVNNSKGAAKFQWNFGDNTSSSSMDPVHIYSQIGQYDVMLIAIDEIGCRDTLLVENAVVATGPNSNILPSDSVICHPNPITFSDESTSAVSWKWLFGDGNSSTDESPVHTYQTIGTYNVSLLATDIDGCQQFATFDSIRVIPTPKASIDIINPSHCLPVEIETINNSSDLQNATFNWSFGDGATSDLRAPKHLYTESGEYEVTLEIMNEGRCVDNTNLEGTIVVYDTTFISQPYIFRLSVKDNREIEVNCDPYLENNFKYNVVYRGTISESEFVPYDTLRSALASLYSDREVEPGVNPYLYVFQTHVYCHEPVSIENLRHYKSINVKSKIANDAIELSWNHYMGHEFSNYLISRKGLNNEWKDIASVAGSQNTYTDDEDLCPGKYDYRVRAINLDGKEYYSESNLTGLDVVNNVFVDQKVEIARTTVMDDKYTYTEWKEPVIGPDKVVYYEVLRGESDDYKLIDHVPAGVTSYYDEEVDVQTGSYQYKIRVVNVCDIETQLSNMGKSILLQKETDNYRSRIFWTPYEGWEKGVGKYKLQRLNDFGEWETVEELDSLKLETVIDLSNK